MSHFNCRNSSYESIETIAMQILVLPSCNES